MSGGGDVNLRRGAPAGHLVSKDSRKACIMLDRLNDDMTLIMIMFFIMRTMKRP